MKKKLGIGALMLMVSSTTFAGGLLTNTNQHVAFSRNPAREASTGIEAVYTNPAGLAFLYRDGMHLSLNIQSAFQTRTIVTGYQPFLMNADGMTNALGQRTYKGEASAPVIPSLHARVCSPSRVVVERLRSTMVWAHSSRKWPYCR